MSVEIATRRSVSTVVLAAAVVFGTIGCSVQATATPASGAASTSAPGEASSTPTSTSADSSADADAPAAGADTETTAVPVEPGTGSVNGPDVASNVSDQLAKVVGQTPDSVTCPDLLAKVGTAIRCELVAGSDTYGLTVTVTTVKGNDVAFDIKVDDQTS